VFDVIGGEILDRSAALVRAGGTLVTTIREPTVLPKDARAVFFVVETDRSQLADLAQRVRDGRLKPIVGVVRPLAEAPAALSPDRRTPARRSSGSPKVDDRPRVSDSVQLGASHPGRLRRLAPLAAARRPSVRASKPPGGATR
jgi:hypothetical protein